MGLLPKLFQSTGIGALVGGENQGINSSNNLEKQRVQAILAQLQQAKLEAAQGQQAGINTARGSVAAIDKGYGDATKNVALGAGSAVEAAQDNETRALSGVGQGVANAGLYNTSVLQNRSRGVAGDTSRTIDALKFAVANHIASLNVGQANAKAGALSRVAGLEGAAGQTQAGISEQMGQAAGSLRLQRKRTAFDLLGEAAPLLGAVAGGALGGAGGAAAGSYLGGGMNSGGAGQPNYNAYGGDDGGA